MEDLIARVAASAGIAPETAQKAVSLILAFLRKEGPQAEVDALFAEVPGALEAAAAGAAEDGGSGGGGFFGSLMGMMGGGGLIGLAGKLTGLGLGMGEMQAIGHEVFAYAREKAGDERVGQVAATIPGLSQFL
ncbi:MAG TPA: DUF2267 domain-containing protein [Beijerinckia sp.]|jgi:hypothetical protein|nr:DUF2267 domain-containing protein [Beijerinckia sp.]